MSFSHGVMKHFITAFLWLCSSSDIINLTLCESKTLWKNCNTAVFKQTPQTFAHSRHFVAKCLCMQIWDQFCSDERKRTSSVWRSAVCLHFVLLFISFIIKGFSVSALCWTLSCNGGINWSTEISAYNYVLSSAHYFTHTHTYTVVQTYCRVWMQKDMYSMYMHWHKQFCVCACLVLKGLPGILLEQFSCNSPQFSDFSAVSSFVITHFSLQTQIN